jgi:hypothetical protein
VSCLQTINNTINIIHDNMAPSSLIDLPVELIVEIFTLCDSLADLHSLSSSCKDLHSTLENNQPGTIYDAILCRALPAFEDALRCQRASVSAIQWMIDVGYDKENLEPLLPSFNASPTKVPLCRFNLQQKRYENIPSEDFIESLSKPPISSKWEATRVLAVHRMLSSILSTARLCTTPETSSPTVSEISWFHTPSHYRMPYGDRRDKGTPWTEDQIERFFRGSYRLWLFGYLFAPGCFWEPIVQEREQFPLLLPLATSMETSWPTWQFDQNDDGRFMQKYPIYMGPLTAPARLNHVVPLFRGFTNWLVHDGERRIDSDSENRQAYETYLDPGKSPNDMDSFDTAAHGGRRELLLLHTMETFFASAFSRNADAGERRTEGKFSHGSKILTRNSSLLNTRNP